MICVESGRSTLVHYFHCGLTVVISVKSASGPNSKIGRRTSITKAVFVDVRSKLQAFFHKVEVLRVSPQRLRKFSMFSSLKLAYYESSLVLFLPERTDLLYLRGIHKACSENTGCISLIARNANLSVTQEFPYAISYHGDTSRMLCYAWLENHRGDLIVPLQTGVLEDLDAVRHKEVAHRSSVGSESSIRAQRRL